MRPWHTYYRREVLATSLEGRPVHVLTITSPAGALDTAEERPVGLDLTPPGARPCAFPPERKVRRCRLPLSKPVLKAPMVSTLETTNRSISFKVCLQFQLAPLQQGVRCQRARAPGQG